MRYQQAESGVISGVWGAHVFVLLVLISPILGCNVVNKARTLRLLALLRSFLLLLWYMKLGLSGSNQWLYLRELHGLHRWEWTL